MREHGVVDPGPPPHHLGGRPAGEVGDQGGRRGRVPDPHVAGDQAPRPRRHQLAGHLCADVERRLGLLAGHGRLLDDVGRAVADLAAQEVGGGVEIAVDADVDHHHLGADLAGDGVDGRPAGAEVAHHLARHLRRPRRDPGLDHAVVAGEHRHRGRLGDGGRARMGDAGQLGTQVLELPQGPGRLGEPPVVLPGLGHGHEVDAGDGGQRIVEGVQHAVIPTFAVDGPAQWPGRGPVSQGQLGGRVELLDVADTEIGDRHDVIGKAEDPESTDGR